MGLVINDLTSNWHITITNSGGGASAVSSVAIGTLNDNPLTQTIVDRVANLMRDGLKPFWDSGWTVGPVHVVENVAGDMFVWDNTATEAGTNGAAVYASPAVSLVVSKVTGLLGKAHRGRFYLPGIQESNVDEAGIIDAGAVTAYQAIIDAFKTSVVGDGAIGNLCLFHDESSPGDHSADVITSLLVRNVVGNMRPRQRR